jgi:hypothetical protein
MNTKMTGPNVYWLAAHGRGFCFGSSGKPARTHREEARESLEHVMGPMTLATTS